jgi:hypothetical protein
MWCFYSGEYVYCWIKVPTGADYRSNWVQLGALLSLVYTKEGSWRVLAIGALMGGYLLLLGNAQMMGLLLFYSHGDSQNFTEAMMRGPLG